MSLLSKDGTRNDVFCLIYCKLHALRQPSQTAMMNDFAGEKLTNQCFIEWFHFVVECWDFSCKFDDFDLKKL